MTKELMDLGPDINKSEEADEKEKIPSGNKGGRPKGRPKYGNCKLNIYLSEEEFRAFNEFISEVWHDKNSSGAGRYLLLLSLHDWVKKGKRKL